MNAVSALTPLAADVVVTGHDREEVGLLVFPSAAGQGRCRPTSCARRSQRQCARCRPKAAARRRARRRVLLLDEPPSVDAGEITDKGYVNQRAVLARRAAEVEALYAEPADPRVIRI